jgi:hypothetical protein
MASRTIPLQCASLLGELALLDLEVRQLRERADEEGEASP